MLNSADEISCGFNRISTSLVEPKYCTSEPIKPSCASFDLICSTFAVLSNPASTRVPPVKSIPNLRPWIDNEPMDIAINIPEKISAYICFATNSKVGIFMAFKLIERAPLFFYHHKPY